MPQIMLVIGQRGSGKSTIASTMAKKTNMEHIDYPKWVVNHGLEEENDETVCLALIRALAEVRKPRVVLEGFPRNEFQAKFFLRNCAPPSHVFFLSCSMDVSQARIDELGDQHSNYVSSVQLAKEVKQFADDSSTFLPYMKEKTNFFEINTEDIFENTMK